MRLLTNFPLELFGPRADFPFDEILSFGPAQGRQVGDLRVPYDYAFDAGRGSLDELLHGIQRQHAGFAPDALMLWWPDQDPIPIGLEDASIPSIAVFSDYNLTLPVTSGLTPFFDLLLCDHPGLAVLGRLPFARVEPWCQYSFRPDVHHEYPGTTRDLDVSFLGNLHPVIQRNRAPWLERLQALSTRYRIHIGNATQGEEYGRLLARSRIAFNRSVRGEVNLRCFEATACGALLFCERENTEIRDYFREDEEVVLYGPEDFEDKLAWFLEHEEQRQRIAAAGMRRVQEHRLAQLSAGLPGLFGTLDIGRRPRMDEVSRLLGRGEALLGARTDGVAALSPLVRAARLEDSARTRNSLAVGLVTRGPKSELANAERLLRQAHALEAGKLAVLCNLARLTALRGDRQAAERLQAEARERASSSNEPRDFAGLVLPLGFQSRALAHAAALAESLRTNDLEGLRRYFMQLTEQVDPEAPMPGWSAAFDPRALQSLPAAPIACKRSKV